MAQSRARRSLAARLGMRLVSGRADAEAAALMAGGADQRVEDIEDVLRRSGADVSALVRLAEADAFRLVRRRQSRGRPKGGP